MDFSWRRFFGENLYIRKGRREKNIVITSLALIVLLSVLMREKLEARIHAIKYEKQIKLTELSGTGGGFEVFEDSYYIYDQYEFSLKKFNLDGSLIKSKSLRGIGPGETTTKESILFTDEGHLYILDPIARKVIKLDKELNFVNEYKLVIPASRIKSAKYGFVASASEIGTKYKRTIYYLNEKFENPKVLFSEEGKKFERKIETNELYITFDVFNSIVAIATQTGIKIISLDGKVLNTFSLEIKPTIYSDKELSKILRHIPEMAREHMIFDYYPKFLFLCFLKKDKLLIISGESKGTSLKAFILRPSDGKILKEILWEGSEPKIKKGKVYSIKEDEICNLIIYSLSKLSDD